jgi:AcrR family transcriptional regulator
MADVDEQLLDTAERLYYARSIQGVGMAELRDESGVPLKRIYQLHPGKEDIVAAYLQRRDARWRAELAVHVGRAKDPRKRVLAVFDWLQEQLSEPGYNGDAWTNAYGELGSTSEVVAEEVRRHKAALREYLSELVADAGGGRSTAHAIYLLFEGAMATAAIEQSPKAAKQARKAAQALLDH